MDIMLMSVQALWSECAATYYSLLFTVRPYTYPHPLLPPHSVCFGECSLCKDIIRRGKLPIVTGSSVFYLRMLINGTRNTPKRDPDAEAALMTALGPAGWDAAVEQLAQVDPATADVILRNDWRRLVRAMDVANRTGQTINSFEVVKPDLNFRCAYLTMDRESLRHRITSRCEYILATGLVEETVNAMCASSIKDTRVPSLLGYRQVFDYLEQFWFQPTNKSTAHKRKAFYKLLSSYIVASRRAAAEQLRFLRRADSPFVAYQLDEYGSEAVALQDFADLINGDTPECFFRETQRERDHDPIDLELEIYSDLDSVDMKVAEIQGHLIKVAKEQGWPLLPLLDRPEDEVRHQQAPVSRRRYLERS
eukprot:TRINITY_DN8327_c0_g1_i1.p1 TRINITY_DN8327_c0_g1~~TRINITY_DN8327_c0_g1_i1.p1  ORF type:complete len:364 (+),score=88.67 TRINITY_DN8327_c0_g1_i1:53-1144(+)